MKLESKRGLKLFVFELIPNITAQPKLSNLLVMQPKLKPFLVGKPKLPLMNLLKKWLKVTLY